MSAHPDPLPMTADLFGGPGPDEHAAAARRVEIAPGAALLRGHAAAVSDALLEALDEIVAAAPWRHMEVPGGHRMSVAMTNCGSLGWVSDRRGYRYAAVDPLTGCAWPPLPAAFAALAASAAAEAGFGGFVPDACLVNRYDTGARLSLHRDADERDFGHPIVSVSLGVPATFLFGATTRSAPTTRIAVGHGDVVVWGGPARMRYHGVATLKAALHPRLGSTRINLTLRKAG